MSHIWMSHVTQMNESCHTCEWVMSHMWMDHVAHAKKSRHTLLSTSRTRSQEFASCHITMGHVPYEWVMSHNHESCPVEGRRKNSPGVRSHVTHMHASCHTYECVMAHKQIGRATRTNESCHTYKWVMSHLWESHVAHENGSYHTLFGRRKNWPGGRSHVTRMHASCHTYVCVMANKRIGRATRTNESCHTYKWVMSHLWKSHVTAMKESYHNIVGRRKTPQHTHTHTQNQTHKHTRTHRHTHASSRATSYHTHIKEVSRVACGVATISRLLEITGLFLQKSPIKENILCKRDLSF